MLSGGFVEAHGGQLRNTRNTGSGATFEFTLPSVAAAPEHRAPAHPSIRAG